MNGSLFLRTWRAQRVKVAIVSAALVIWSALMPVIYGSFGAQFTQLIEAGLIPREFTEFGGGDVFSLSGSIALGAIHPIAIALNAVFAVGFAAAAIAGERQRGTLEVLLARPISRRTVYLTLFVAMLLFVGLVVAAAMAGAVAGSALAGVLDELDLGLLPLVWLNAVLLFAAIGSIGLAASASFDRLAAPLGITLAVVVVGYFLEVLGSIWPDAEWLQPYSLFHYFDAKAVLTGGAEPFDFVLLGVVVAGGLAWALLVFPRRDLAAPS
jgi:ABC-2 type transport system permease protein